MEKRFEEVNVALLYVDMGGTQIYEMFWGDHLHPGAEEESKILAERAGITKDKHVLDICCGIGGPARFLAKTYGCKVTGIDILEQQYNEAVKRTKEQGLDRLVDFRICNAMEVPFSDGAFDVVWGQDGWCHVPDKGLIIKEAARVLKKGGIIAFTDHMATEQTSDTALEQMSQIAIPNLFTIKDYAEHLKKNGLEIISQEDIGEEMREDYKLCLKKVETELKDRIISRFGEELYHGTYELFTMMVGWLDNGELGRGRFIAKKL